LRNEGPGGGFPTFYQLNRERSTVGVWLQDAGYRTALIGKFLNGYPHTASPGYVPQGWDEWDVTTSLNYYDYKLISNGQIVPYGSAPEDYLTDVLATKANDFVVQAAAADVPFFLYLAPRAPHGPSTPAPRHAGTLPGVLAPRSPSFNERNIGDKPQWVRQSGRLSQGEVTQLDAEYQRRMESLLAVDEMVAGLIETLRATGTLDNVSTGCRRARARPTTRRSASRSSSAGRGSTPADASVTWRRTSTWHRRSPIWRG
jgi:arylsulfatase A-like enzyme